MHGLTEDEATKRLAEYGPNKLPESTRNPILVFLGYMWNPLSWAMEVAAIIAIALLDYADFALIVALLLVNATISYVEESNADKAIKVRGRSPGRVARAAPASRATRPLPPALTSFTGSFPTHAAAQRRRWRRPWRQSARWCATRRSKTWRRCTWCRETSSSSAWATSCPPTARSCQRRAAARARRCPCRYVRTLNAQIPERAWRAPLGQRSGTSNARLHSPGGHPRCAAAPPKLALQIDQAALTGESIPAKKFTGAVAFSGSTIKQGERHAVVYATGINTFFGRAAALISGTHNEANLQVRAHTQCRCGGGVCGRVAAGGEMPVPSAGTERNRFHRVWICALCGAHAQIVMKKIGACCLITIGVWVVIELAVQFGHYGHSCEAGEGARFGFPPLSLRKGPCALRTPSAPPQLRGR